MPTIIHFRDRCIGCNTCVEHDPDKWEISTVDGKSNLKKAVDKKGVFVLKVNSIEAEKNKKAAQDCPVGIIKVQE